MLSSHGIRVRFTIGVHDVIPLHLTIWLRDVLVEIHVLQGEVSQPPARVLTWICRNKAERSKKIVFLPIVASYVVWLERYWKHGRW